MSRSQHPKPRVVLSRCLGFDACRYNGQRLQDHIADSLKPFADIITVCPEMDIGMGVPRHPVRLVQGGPGEELELVQSATGKRFGTEMREFSKRFLDEIGPVHAFILKSRSPSCGPGNCKLYGKVGDDEVVGRVWGLFAALVKERFPEHPLLSEEELQGPEEQERFLARLRISRS